MSFDVKELFFSTDLICASKLEMNIEVLLVQSLQTGVEHTAHQGTLRLLDDVCTRMLSSFASGKRVESAHHEFQIINGRRDVLVDIKGIFGGQLVARPSHKFEFVHWYSEGHEQRFQEKRVVFRPPFDSIQRGFASIQKGVQVCSTSDSIGSTNWNTHLQAIS